MKWILSLAALVAVAALLWMRAESNQAPLQTRTVALDNVYGGVKTLQVHVTVDRGKEQRLTATCTPQVCTFELPLTDGEHDLSVVVEQNGRRSRPAALKVGTRNPSP